MQLMQKKLPERQMQIQEIKQRENGATNGDCRLIPATATHSTI